jgi:hypothetical protein
VVLPAVAGLGSPLPGRRALPPASPLNSKSVRRHENFVNRVASIVILALAAACGSHTGELSSRVLRPYICPFLHEYIVGEAVVTGEVIVGRVVVESWPDEGLRPLSGATVTLRRLGEPEVLSQAATDRLGQFELASPTPGMYQIEACLEGLAPRVVPLRVRRGWRSRDVLLELGTH